MSSANCSCFYIGQLVHHWVQFTEVQFKDYMSKYFINITSLNQHEATVRVYSLRHGSNELGYIDKFDECTLYDENTY